MIDQPRRLASLRTNDRNAKVGGCLSRALPALFGIVFFTAGTAMLYFMAFVPLSKISDSKTWVETPCKVVWSRVRSYDSDEGDDTYDVEVLFEYTVGEELHRSNNYSFVSGSSSGYSGKSKIVKQHPPGKEMVCYVNPETPEQAVLNRELSSIGFWWLFPLPFILIGAVVLFFAFFGTQTSDISEE